MVNVNKIYMCILTFVRLVRYGSVMLEKKPLGEMLVDAGVINRQDLKVALESQKQVPAPLGKTLVQLGIADEADILPILSRQLNVSDAVISPLGTEEATSVSVALDRLFRQATEAEATDIHFEPVQGGVKVRARIDGVLREMEAAPILRRQYTAAVSRVKILCNLDIAEKRMPQEGRTTLQVGEQTVDLRVSVLPSRFGESIVIRILHSEIPMGLTALGMDPGTRESFGQLLRRRSGLILVTGPTGCGKTTTLYAGMDQLNDDRKKIVTIEDPIEYTLPGAIQMQVAPQIDLTFGRLLRTVLRHDPDVVMVGEIRDMETTEVAIRTALTGHLVLSTLHTNDAVSTIIRLLEMGVEPYLVSSSLSCVIGQRLVRTVCPKCGGRRCVQCMGEGLKGRTGIFEFLLMDEQLRAMVLKQCSADEIRQHARSRGMKTLHEDGMRKVEAGITTAEEVDRVIHSEDVV